MKEKFESIHGFDWDVGNREKNRILQNVLNGECEEIFFNYPLIIIDDEKHSQKEKRMQRLELLTQGENSRLFLQSEEI